MFDIKEVSINALIEIAVYNQEANDYILSVLNEKKINLPVSVKQDWYY